MDQDVRITREFSSFLAVLGALRVAHLHKSLKASTSNDGGQMQQVDPSKNDYPNLSREDARREDVPNRLLLLVAEKVYVRMLELATCQSIRAPASVEYGQSKEHLTPKSVRASIDVCTAKKWLSPRRTWRRPNVRNRNPISLASIDVGAAGFDQTGHSPKHPKALGSPRCWHEQPKASKVAHPAQVLQGLVNRPPGPCSLAHERHQSRKQILDGLAVKPPLLPAEC